MRVRPVSESSGKDVWARSECLVIANLAGNERILSRNVALLRKGREVALLPRHPDLALVKQLSARYPLDHCTCFIRTSTAKLVPSLDFTFNVPQQVLAPLYSTAAAMFARLPRSIAARLSQS